MTDTTTGARLRDDEREAWEQVQRALHFLYLEAPESVVDDVRRKVEMAHDLLTARVAEPSTHAEAALDEVERRWLAKYPAAGTYGGELRQIVREVRAALATAPDTEQGGGERG